MKITKNRLKEIIADVLREESEYQKFFKKALEKSGKSIPQMSDDEKKAFFNKIQTAWKGRGKKNEELNSSDIGKGDNKQPSKDASDSSNIK